MMTAPLSYRVDYKQYTQQKYLRPIWNEGHMRFATKQDAKRFVEHMQITPSALRGSHVRIVPTSDPATNRFHDGKVVSLTPPQQGRMPKKEMMQT
jgi:hypothetical protein